MKRLKGWRTVLVNAVFALLPAIDAIMFILGSDEFKAILSPEVYKWYALAMVIGNVWLRSITTTPMGQRHENQH